MKPNLTCELWKTNEETDCTYPGIEKNTKILSWVLYIGSSPSGNDPHFIMRFCVEWNGIAAAPPELRMLYP